jgi:hypothetical protein
LLGRFHAITAIEKEDFADQLVEILFFVGMKFGVCIFCNFTSVNYSISISWKILSLSGSFGFCGSQQRGFSEYPSCQS